MRLLSWNILQGGGSRASGIADAIVELKPDIITCQEFRNGKSAPTVLAAFDELELTHRYIPNAEKAKNTVVVASRYAFDTEQWDSSLDHSLAMSARIRIDDDTSEYALTLHTAHLPQKKKQESSSQWFSRSLFCCVAVSKQI